LPTRIYRIEILGDGGKDAAPVAVIPHDAPDDLEAYLSAEARVRALQDPRMVSWRLVMLTDDGSQTVRLKKDQQRVVDQRRDDVFFAARRVHEDAEKRKFEALKAQRLAAAKKRSLEVDGEAAFRARKPQKSKRAPIVLERSEE
jgi:hypothetical protein